MVTAATCSGSVFVAHLNLCACVCVRNSTSVPRPCCAWELPTFRFVGCILALCIFSFFLFLFLFVSSLFFFFYSDIFRLTYFLLYISRHRDGSVSTLGSVALPLSSCQVQVGAHCNNKGTCPFAAHNQRVHVVFFFFCRFYFFGIQSSSLACRQLHLPSATLQRPQGAGLRLGSERKAGAFLGVRVPAYWISDASPVCPGSSTP